MKNPIEAEKQESERTNKQTSSIKYVEEQKVSIGKGYSVNKIREKHKDAYKPWTDELDEQLTEKYCENETVKDMATYFGRTKGAIYSRIKKLELEDLYE